MHLSYDSKKQSLLTMIVSRQAKRGNQDDRPIP